MSIVYRSLLGMRMCFLVKEIMMKKFKLSALAAMVITVTACSGQNAAMSGGKSQLNTKESADLNKNGKIEPYEDIHLSDDQRIDDLLARMSLDQKVKMVTGTGFALNNIGGSQKVPGAAGSTYDLTEFGIPSIVLADGPAGLRISPTREGDKSTYYATAFPIATTLASTWNTELVEQVGKAMGEEVKEYGVDVFLAPGMNIQLNPLAGRNFEYYSEDPLLSGKMAASIVNGVESFGVGTTIKHFVANNVETSRMLLDAKIDDRAMREIYLKGFEIAVKEAQPWAVMSSYNKVNGTYTSQSKALLTTVLRDEWGFEGTVMTDWFSGDDSAAQMAAGNDLIMPGMDGNRQQITQAVNDGSLKEAELDRNLRNIFKLIFRSPAMSQYQYSNKPDLLAHADVARQVAAEGVVLLKNDKQTLPLSSTIKNIAAFGNTSYDFIAGGTGSGDVNEAYTVSLVDGLENANLKIDTQLQGIYQSFAKVEKAKQIKPKTVFELVPPIPEMPVDINLIAEKAKSADVALITLGRNSGEFKDRDASDFELSAIEQTLIHQVSQEFHKQNKKVVVILNIGNVIETASWKDKVDAIVLPWQGGQEAGNAVVDVLTGKVNPSGKLAVTYPVSYQQIPSAATFPGTPLSDEIVIDPYLGMPLGKRSEIEYNEGIYVGYRYFDTFQQAVSYPFGYGLSYTDFSYSNPTISSNTFGGELSISVKVTNIGKTPGKEVVELFINAPVGQLEKPQQELKGFAKTNLLAPGHSEILTFSLDALRLASYNAKLSQWVVEKGQYQVNLSASSRDVKQQLSFTVDKTLVLGDKLVSIKPKQKLKLLTQ